LGSKIFFGISGKICVVPDHSRKKLGGLDTKNTDFDVFVAEVCHDFIGILDNRVQK